mmetsp:Transcript_8823/g.22206  ORF Transcript_8823/g.22206 Transcript_8823/m.22206 type:complete len:110 (+) Transcript_8823:2906-3235(+)
MARCRLARGALFPGRNLGRGEHGRLHAHTQPPFHPGIPAGSHNHAVGQSVEEDEVEVDCKRAARMPCVIAQRLAAAQKCSLLAPPPTTTSPPSPPFKSSSGPTDQSSSV